MFNDMFPYLLIVLLWLIVAFVIAIAVGSFIKWGLGEDEVPTKENSNASKDPS